MSEAVNLLVAPGEPDDSMTEGFWDPGDLFNYLSPSAYISSMIESVTGVDVFGTVTDALAGDWASFYRFGDALISMADFLQEIGVQIQSGFLDLDRTWNGNADDSVFVYFSNLASAVSRQQDALHQASDGYHEAAKGAYQFSKQLGNVLQALVDSAILMAASAAIGTATAETGVGLLVGYGLAASQVLRVLELANKAAIIVSTAWTAIFGSFGLIVDLASQGGDLSQVPLPANTFALPEN
ncbi:hypothetical protein [Actinoplanes sp. L3-i22]|uniref:hypothetical protein n=1 Tax=Actinoplanes sp. L3-i22 TaxID=2836373 RepID=UPI001C7494E6|nr:hypothetical protein [Actinoplanes sp. L3-i22]BCY08816.1 hypothetical protein L3i22_039040 [Actinoplanes sp. L3-i22]